MDINYKVRPNDDLLRWYCKKIEYFLSGICVKLNITLYEVPGIKESHSGGYLISKECQWLEDFIVSTPLGILKLKHKPRFGIDNQLSDNEIWSDALFIQNEVYNNFNLPFPNPNDSADPYWNLWKKYKK